ncbi:hypothetical protein QL285_033135 [Trifolium repens]|nr:hypothetical protein QL285_033135 [Trifolium repens]
MRDLAASKSQVEEEDNEKVDGVVSLYMNDASTHPSSPVNAAQSSSASPPQSPPPPPEIGIRRSSRARKELVKITRNKIKGSTSFQIPISHQRNHSRHQYLYLKECSRPTSQKLLMDSEAFDGSSENYLSSDSGAYVGAAFENDL